MQSSKEGRKKVFVSYSHTDGEWLKRLQIHLRDLERRGLIELWDDTRIKPGAKWRKEINEALNSARVAVLLISADFIASDFIAQNELPPLLAAAENDGVTILPLILSPSRFEKIQSLAGFQSINHPSKPLIGLPKVEQEEYLVKLSEAVFKAMEEPAVGSVETGQSKGPRISNLPAARNRYFTGREDLLNRLHTRFNNGEAVQALGGLGGIGKTQTALEYAYRYRQDYAIVLWAMAYSREALVADFAAMAGLLNLREKDAVDQSLAVNAVKRWFENNSGWLLILDNADDLAMAREFIPSSGSGHALLTTRALNTGKIALRDAVEKMEPPEGAFFLLRRLKKVKDDEPPESVAVELRTQAEALSRMVDGLPLALDQAAAYIEETPSTLDEYMQLYRSGRAELLAARGELVDDHRESVAITFSLAFKKVAEANEAAAELLRVCAFLEADAIPEEIFREGASELGGALGAIAGSPVKLTEAIKEACRFSLLKRDPEARTVSLHRLVQATLIDEMDDAARRTWAERALRAVNKIFPEIEYSNWPSCSRLVPHVQSLAQSIDEFGFDFSEAAGVMNEAGWYLSDRAQYAEAEPLLKRALAIREKMLGPEHVDTAKSLNSLAYLYYFWGKYEEAAPIYQRALAIKEEALGPEHPDTATSLNNLAALYYSQGRYGEAEPLYRRALAIWEKESGPEHPDIAKSLNNLAVLYSLRGKYEEAELLYRRALTIYEKKLGPEDPVTATIQYCLAWHYDVQGAFAEAEPLYQRALIVYEQSLGPQHPKVDGLLQHYAALLRKMNREDEAAKLVSRAAEIRAKTGPKKQD